jgi:hypothetical protein
MPAWICRTQWDQELPAEVVRLSLLQNLPFLPGSSIQAPTAIAINPYFSTRRGASLRRPGWHDLCYMLAVSIAKT